MFDNKIFEQWLDKKTEEILSKVDREQITTEEMVILSLKAQSNHFYHMDIEYREEFSNIKQQFKDVQKQFKDVQKQFENVQKQFEQVDKRFEQVDKRFEQVDKRFEQVDKRFEQVDKRFDRLERFGMWAFSLLFTGIAGIFYELLKR